MSVREKEIRDGPTHLQTHLSRVHRAAVVVHDLDLQQPRGWFLALVVAGKGVPRARDGHGDATRPHHPTRDERLDVRAERILQTGDEGHVPAHHAEVEVQLRFVHQRDGERAETREDAEERREDEPQRERALKLRQRHRDAQRVLRRAHPQHHVRITGPEHLEIDLHGPVPRGLVHLDALDARRDAAEGEALETERGEKTRSRRLQDGIQRGDDDVRGGLIEVGPRRREHFVEPTGAFDVAEGEPRGEFAHECLDLGLVERGEIGQRLAIGRAVGAAALLALLPTHEETGGDGTHAETEDGGAQLGQEGLDERARRGGDELGDGRRGWGEIRRRSGRGGGGVGSGERIAGVRVEFVGLDGDVDAAVRTLGIEVDVLGGGVAGGDDDAILGNGRGRRGGGGGARGDRRRRG